MYLIKIICEVPGWSEHKQVTGMKKVKGTNSIIKAQLQLKYWYYIDFCVFLACDIRVHIYSACCFSEFLCVWCKTQSICQISYEADVKLS